jgi:dCMP deaminase
MKNEKVMDWVDYYRNIAEEVKKKSKDKNTQIGAVIVGEGNQIISTGYNSFPRGLNDNIESRQERPEKYFWFEHAERNAIYNAAREGTRTLGTTMYLTCGIPCTGCARAIINAGIKTIYFKKEHHTMTSPKWKDEAERSLEMFYECGVTVIPYENELH